LGFEGSELVVCAGIGADFRVQHFVFFLLLVLCCLLSLEEETLSAEWDVGFCSSNEIFKIITVWGRSEGKIGIVGTQLANT
jgi:hypothetical protein